MIFTLKCKCGAKAFHKGQVEWETNATILNEDKEIEWEGGDTACPHEDFEIVDSEYEDLHD